MSKTYKHTQYGLLTWILLISAGILIIFLALVMFREGRIFSALLMILIYLLGMGIFYSFTTEIDEEQLRFWFGIRMIRKTINLKDIQSAEEVQNPWYYFWGVKAVPGGWLYAIAPGSAVKITLITDKVLHLGTNQPEKLKQALDRACQQLADQ